MVCTILVSFYQRPQRPGGPPRGSPLFPPLGGAVRTGPGWPPLVLWLPPPPRCWTRGWVFPRRFAGSWPDSHSGGGTGFGDGGGADWAAFAAGGGVVLTGITDSSLALLVAVSCILPPLAMRAISFVAATLVAFEVRWTPSRAQMLVPLTVTSSCKGDSSGQKNSRICRILAYEVRAPAAAASVRLFRIRKSLSRNPHPGGLTHGWCRCSRRPGRTWAAGPLAVFWLPLCWR
jgi:hypothetical protein